MELQEFIDSFFKEQMERLQVSGAAIVVVQGDQVAHSQGYGWANLSKNTPVTSAETIFRAGSISKLFTATALLQLKERGQLDLNADINTFLNRFQVHCPGGKPITPAHLLTHTAGLEENYLGMHVHTAQEIVPLGIFLAHHLPPFANPPGKMISYNDHGYSLAGYLIEAITGQPFAQYVAENILEPLEMTSSTFEQPASLALMERMATGYRYRRGRYYPYTLDYVNVVPAAGLIASADDMAHFMIANLNAGVYRGMHILSPETLTEMHARQFTNHPRLRGRAYGFSEWLENGQRGLFHDGGNPGFMSRLFLLPAQKTGFYISLNGDQQSRASQLPRLFTSQYLDQFHPQADIELSPPVPAAGMASHAKRYTGYYREQAGYSSRTLVKLAFLMDQLSVRDHKNHTLRIGSSVAIEVEPRVFRWQEADAYATFGESQTGEIESLFFGTGAFKKLHWFEAKPFQLGLITLFLLGFLGMLVTSVFGSMMDGFEREVLGLIGLLNLVFLVGMGLVVNFTDHWEFMYGLPKRVQALLSIPFLSTGREGPY